MIKVRIHLKNLRDKSTLPASHQYELVSAVFRKMPFLQGKHYTVSGLWLIKPFLYEQDTLTLESNTNFEISVYDEDITLKMINDAMYKQTITIANNQYSDNEFLVTGVQALNYPSPKATTNYRAISPITVRYKYEEEIHYSYISPTDEMYKDFFIDALYQKYLNLGWSRVSLEGVDIQILTEPKERLITTKAGTGEELKIKGYLFDFQLTCPIKLQKLGFYGGFGDLPTLGFGASFSIS
jgi:CRISPR-associated endoribonuclease Cas6